MTAMLKYRLNCLLRQLMIKTLLYTRADQSNSYKNLWDFRMAQNRKRSQLSLFTLAGVWPIMSSFFPPCCCTCGCFCIEMSSLFFKIANLFVSIMLSGSGFCKLIKCIKKLFVPCWLLGIRCFSVALSAPLFSQIMHQANWSCLSKSCLGRKVQEELLVFYKSQGSLCCSSLQQE